MDTNKPNALRLAALLNADVWPGSMTLVSYARECAAELRRQHAENEKLRTGYDAARLEIESLQARLQELGQMARECSDRKVVKLDARIKELEGQLDAVGAGGVEPLRKRECLHHIAEPAPLNKATAEHALRRILHIVQRYLPPDGTSIDKAMNEIIAVVDPWPVAEGDAGMYPQLPDPFMTSHEEAGCCYPDTFSADQMRAYADADRAARGAAQAVPADAPHTELEDAARALVEAIEYTPLGLRSIKALEKVRAALSSSAQAAPVDAAVPTKVIEALEMLENGALNVAMNAKNRGDGYDEGYANAMAKMARETLDALAAAPAGAPVVLPEPDVFAKVSHKGAAKWDVEFTWPVGKFEEDGDHKLYTEQQVRAMLAAAPKPPARKPLRCSCHTCWPIAADDPASTFMRLCPACGNKRCPKANDHRHACTGSNEPGQPGSAYQLTGGITAAQKGDAPK